MASFFGFILPVQGARPLLFLCENRELQKRREKKEILKPFAEALQTYGRFLRNYSLASTCEQAQGNRNVSPACKIEDKERKVVLRDMKRNEKKKNSRPGLAQQIMKR